MTDFNEANDGADTTRQRIIEAALELFTTQGYARTTTRAIATAAGVNEVTVFRHFGSKQNLFMAGVQSFNATGFAETFEQYLTGDYAADIRMMARMQQQAMAHNYHMMRLLMCEINEFGDVLDAALAGGQGNQARIAAYFRRQIDAGVVRADLDPEALAHACDSLFSTAEFYRQTFGAGFVQDMDGDRLLDHLVDLFVQGTIRQE